jgi:hypothetical protein
MLCGSSYWLVALRRRALDAPVRASHVGRKKPRGLKRGLFASRTPACHRRAVCSSAGDAGTILQDCGTTSTSQGRACGCGRFAPGAPSLNDPGGHTEAT